MHSNVNFRLTVSGTHVDICARDILIRLLTNSKFGFMGGGGGLNFVKLTQHYPDASCLPPGPLSSRGIHKYPKTVFRAGVC